MEKGTMLTTTMIKNVTTELSPILKGKVCHQCIVVFYTNPPLTQEQFWLLKFTIFYNGKGGGVAVMSKLYLILTKF